MVAMAAAAARCPALLARLGTAQHHGAASFTRCSQSARRLGSSAAARAQPDAGAATGAAVPPPFLDSHGSDALDPATEAILVLGGGLLPGGGLPPWVVRRLQVSLHLHRLQGRHPCCARGSGRALARLSPANARPSPSSVRATDLGAAGGRCPIVLLGAGTPHKPPVIDARGYVVHESTAYADYLMQQVGLPACSVGSAPGGCSSQADPRQGPG